MTNAFSTRRQNKGKIGDLRRSIQHVLDEMTNLREDSRNCYFQYLSQLSKVLPSKEESSLPAEVIATRLSYDEDERRSVCASLRGLAHVAEHKRRVAEWNKDHPKEYETRADNFSTLPALKTSRRITTRHFAELDDEGSVIRQWDVKKFTTNYYLDKEG